MLIIDEYLVIFRVRLINEINYLLIIICKSILKFEVIFELIDYNYQLLHYIEQMILFYVRY